MYLVSLAVLDHTVGTHVPLTQHVAPNIMACKDMIRDVPSNVVDVGTKLASLYGCLFDQEIFPTGQCAIDALTGHRMEFVYVVEPDHLTRQRMATEGWLLPSDSPIVTF